MEPQMQKQLFGIVIRADGTVPFDDDCDPNVRAATIMHLMDNGHAVSLVKGTNHAMITDWKRGKAVSPVSDAAALKAAQAVDAYVGDKI